jgi:soluble lytic murein transglycosylase-like protein
MAHTAIENVGSGLLTKTPQDVQGYCPSYDDLNQAQRRTFWVYLLSRLARFESNHDLSVSYTESFNDAQGNRVISRGLLQVSKESANGYGCGIGDATELHDPETNIRCGVRILNRWVAERDRVIAARTNSQWRGAVRYWRPFRSDSRRAQIASATVSQPCCQ